MHILYGPAMVQKVDSVYLGGSTSLIQYQGKYDNLCLSLTIHHPFKCLVESLCLRKVLWSTAQMPFLAGSPAGRKSDCQRLMAEQHPGDCPWPRGAALPNLGSLCPVTGQLGGREPSPLPQFQAALSGHPTLNSRDPLSPCWRLHGAHLLSPLTSKRAQLRAWVSVSWGAGLRRFYKAHRCTTAHAYCLLIFKCTYILAQAQRHALPTGLACPLNILMVESSPPCPVPQK